MTIETISIRGLRGFATENSLQFAQPNGTPGSGLTIVLGPNGGGKSTVLEALRAAATSTDVSFTQGQRNIEAGDEVSIRWRRLGGAEGSLCSVRPGSSEVLRQGDIPNLMHVASRRAFNPFFGSGSYSREVFARSLQIPTYRGQLNDAFGGRLIDMERAGRRAAFDELIENVAGYSMDWSIDRQDSGQYFVKVRNASGYNTSDGMGEGSLSLLVIADALHDSKAGDIIAIDEPELSLHPIHQRRLSDVFSRYAADRQLIIATHSPYFLDWRDLVSGGGITRIYASDGKSTIATPNRETITQMGRFTLDLQNPHVLGLNASEVFFLEDRVILTEGQEDVLVYRALAREIDVTLRGEFFGWGVGGAEKMGYVARLLLELGYRHVVGILDGNKAMQAEKLRSEFPYFRFLVIPVDDVRTKSARPATVSVDGLADSAGRMRPEYEAAVRNLFTQINDGLA